jgi:hypothetical protein
MDRRKFFKSAGLGLAGSSLLLNSCANAEARDTGINYSQLDEILSRGVLKKELFTNPVIIKQVSLLQYGDSMLCRVVSRDGDEGISVSNDLYMTSLYPIFVKRVQPWGSTTYYAFMQAGGMVNDHLVNCFRHSEVGRNK